VVGNCSAMTTNSFSDNSLIIRRLITSDTNYTDDYDVTINQRATTVIELYRLNVTEDVLNIMFLIRPYRCDFKILDSCAVRLELDIKL
jgi:hypothetical protein